MKREKLKVAVMSLLFLAVTGILLVFAGFPARSSRQDADVNAASERPGNAVRPETVGQGAGPGTGEGRMLPDYAPPASEEGERLRGRDFVRIGEFSVITGVLEEKRGEWYLVVDGVDHEIHMGDHDHRAATGIRLETGREATVRGFLYDQEDRDYVDIAATVIEMDGEEYRFRNDDGSPLWRGRGSGQGTGGGDGGGAGREGSGRGREAGR